MALCTGWDKKTGRIGSNMIETVDIDRNYSFQKESSDNFATPIVNNCDTICNTKNRIVRDLKPENILLVQGLS